MAPLQIQPVSSRLAGRQFLDLPWQLHRDLPHWIPPLRQNQAELSGFRRHPFYLDASHQPFLATREGRPVGRIIAIQNHAYDRAHPDESTGFVGFFESVDESEVSRALFAAACDWLHRQDRRLVRGPVNPSMNYECGLLVQNFERAPTFMMPYNPPYYERLWQDYGFRKAQDLFSFCGKKRGLQTLEQKIVFVAQEAQRRFDIRIRPLRRRHFFKDVKAFLELYNRSLTANWGHAPMSSAEVRHLAQSLRFLIVPELTLLAEVQGQPIGAILGLLDYNPRIKQIDGKLFPFGFLRLLTRRREIKRLRLVSSNVAPEYQRWGVGVVLAYALIEPALRWGLEEGEFSWVLESNHLSRKSLERAGVPVEKVHRIFEKDL